MFGHVLYYGQTSSAPHAVLAQSRSSEHCGTYMKKEGTGSTLTTMVPTADGQNPASAGMDKALKILG